MDPQLCIWPGAFTIFGWCRTRKALPIVALDLSSSPLDQSMYVYTYPVFPHIFQFEGFRCSSHVLSTLAWLQNIYREIVPSRLCAWQILAEKIKSGDRTLEASCVPSVWFPNADFRSPWLYLTLVQDQYKRIVNKKIPSLVICKFWALE